MPLKEHRANESLIPGMSGSLPDGAIALRTAFKVKEKGCRIHMQLGWYGSLGSGEGEIPMDC